MQRHADSWSTLMCPDVRWSAVCSLKGLLEMARPSGEVKKRNMLLVILFRMIWLWERGCLMGSIFLVNLFTKLLCLPDLVIWCCRFPSVSLAQYQSQPFEHVWWLCRPIASVSIQSITYPATVSLRQDHSQVCGGALSQFFFHLRCSQSHWVQWGVTFFISLVSHM